MGTLHKDALGRWTNTIGGQAWTISLHKYNIERLTQKGTVLDWLKQQPADMTFSPDSHEQCVLGRMMKDIFGTEPNFIICLTEINFVTPDGFHRSAPFTSFAAAYQKRLLDYLDTRDGESSGRNGTVTRVEAVKIAKETPGR